MGIVARQVGSGDIPFLEVYACEGLAAHLRVDPDQMLQVRVLSGKLLAGAP
jgi:hypothetical protein